MKRSLISGLGLLLISSFVISVSAQLVEDQSQKIDNLGWCSIVVQASASAQTFVPEVKGYLRNVSMLINYWRNTPGDLIVQIQSTAMGKAVVGSERFGYTTTRIPTGTVLASTIIPQPIIPISRKTWVNAQFNAPALLNTSDTVALVLITTAPTCPDPDPCDGLGYNWYVYSDAFSPFDAYPKGEAMQTKWGTWNWAVWRHWGDGPICNNVDFCFITYMDPISIKGTIDSMIALLQSVNPPGVNGLLVKLNQIKDIMTNAMAAFNGGTMTKSQFIDQCQNALSVLATQFRNQLDAKIANGQIPDPAATSLTQSADMLKTLIEDQITKAQ